MRTLREWIHRLWETMYPGRRDGDLEQELRSHLELAAEDARRRGLDPTSQNAAVFSRDPGSNCSDRGDINPRRRGPAQAADCNRRH